MLKRPKVKVLSEAEIQTINQASAQQTGKQSVPKTYDVNYPVFEIPVNQKVLIYVPNHRVQDSNGVYQLRMDKFAAHPVLDGKTYGNVRCTQGVELQSLGLDGSCPLCDCLSETWELYNLELESIAKGRGIDSKSEDSKELLKQDRIDLVKARAVKEAEVWYTFPIVVIECEEKNGQLTTTPKRTADGQLIGKPYFYSIREKTYISKWLPAFDAIDDGNTNPAGMWVILNFAYTTSDKATKMQSANNLKVSFKMMSEDYDAWAKHYDELTKDWTPQKAQEVLVLDSVRDMEEMKEVSDKLMTSTRDKILMFKNVKGTNDTPAQVGDGSLGDAQATLEQFGAKLENGGLDMNNLLEENNSGLE